MLSIAKSRILGCYFVYRIGIRAIIFLMEMLPTEKTINSKFEVDKFNSKINFGLWQVQMMDIFIQEGLHKTLKGKYNKSEKMKDEEWEERDLRACSTIDLMLARELISSVAN